MTNGATNGVTNGATTGATNAATNGTTNGTANGPANGADMRSRISQAYHNLGTHCLPAVEFALIKSFIDYKAWDAIPEAGDIGVGELAEKIGGTQEVVGRITTFFLASELLASPAPGRVAHTPKSLIYRSCEPTAGLYVHMFNTLFRPLAQLPQYFDKYGLASPRDNKNTPFTWAFGVEDKAPHEILVADKRASKEFTGAMKEIGPMYSMKGVYDLGWVEEAIEQPRPAFVDIGGSAGFAVKDVLRNNSFIPAEKCFIVDLPQVVETTRQRGDEELRSVQLQAGNMFEPYPESVRGAQVYHIRRVLNSYPDEDVVRAMENVRKVAAPDSRLLIVEELLGPKRYIKNVLTDIYLMCASGKRRSAAMFGECGERAGWRLNGDFQNVSSEFDDFSVLEFVVAKEAS